LAEICETSEIEFRNTLIINVEKNQQNSNFILWKKSHHFLRKNRKGFFEMLISAILALGGPILGCQVNI